MQKTLSEIVKKAKASTHERKIANETIKEGRNYFNRERNFWTN